MYKFFEYIPMNARKYAALKTYRKTFPSSLSPLPRTNDGYCPLGACFHYMTINDPRLGSSPTGWGVRSYLWEFGMPNSTEMSESISKFIIAWDDGHLLDSGALEEAMGIDTF